MFYFVVIGSKGTTIISIKDNSGAVVKLVRPAIRRSDDHQTDNVLEEKISLSEEVESGKREEREGMERCKMEQNKVNEEESEFEIIGTDETIRFDTVYPLNVFL